MYVGPPIDDVAILAQLPAELQTFLASTNGYVAYHGGLHVRGACLAPDWHSLRSAWEGDDAIHRLFPSVLASDVPFAEDVVGDQFVIRDDFIWKLRAESGDVVPLQLTLAEFDAAARADPDELLELAPLRQFRLDGGELAPGQLLSVYPPFVLQQATHPYSLRAVPTRERLLFLSDLARHLRDIPDGTPIRLEP